MRLRMAAFGAVALAALIATAPHVRAALNGPCIGTATDEATGVPGTAAVLIEVSARSENDSTRQWVEKQTRDRLEARRRDQFGWLRLTTVNCWAMRVKSGAELDFAISDLVDVSTRHRLQEGRIWLIILGKGERRPPEVSVVLIPSLSADSGVQFFALTPSGNALKEVLTNIPIEVFGSLATLIGRIRELEIAVEGQPDALMVRDRAECWPDRLVDLAKRTQADLLRVNSGMLDASDRNHLKAITMEIRMRALRLAAREGRCQSQILKALGTGVDR